jgi:small GTP-binding protein
MKLTEALLKKVIHLRFPLTLFTLLNQKTMEAKMSDLDLIKQLEKEIGRELEKRDFEKITSYMQRGYAINKNGNVIGLNLNDIKLVPLPASLSKLRHLKKLRLRNTRTKDIYFLQGLSNLTDLNLMDNQIKDISSLQGLSNLTDLNLSNNQITDISFLQGLSNLTTLNLSRNQITDISFLQGLSNLTTLYLNNNQITDISFLKGLINLTTLYLMNNQLTDISVLKGLHHLTTLSLGANQITDISFLQGMQNLERLGLRQNKINELPEFIIELGMEIDVDSAHSWENKIYLFGNPLETPPPEIVRKGIEAVKNYFNSLQYKRLPINELKVLMVGDGGAGKTSLVKGLLGQEFDIKEAQTHGINIDAWAVKEAEMEIKVNIWDFGGQEIMHATHQFFLSKRSFYILILDGRKDEKTEYWLKHIESFGGNSPVLVVINKIDENPGFEVNRKFLQEKYKNIKGFHRVSCKSKKGINAFESALKEELSNIEMLKTTWAASWFNVKTRLEKMDEHFISYKKYLDICTNEKINTKSSQDTLVDFLNDLGIAIHFKDLELEDTHVLEPKWVTEAVYKIINSEKLAKCNGVLKVSLLDEILKQKDKEAYYYPRTDEKVRTLLQTGCETSADS